MDSPEHIEEKVLDLSARDAEAVRKRAERRAKQELKKAEVTASAIAQAKTAAAKRELKEAAERSKVAKRRSRDIKMAKAKELFLTGQYSKDWIAVELGVSVGTIRYWLRGLKPDAPEPEPEDQPAEEVEPTAEQQELKDSYLLAREEEEARLMEIADGQGTPADKYQAYAAASAIRMLRDNFKLIRGPRTIRELSELDQLIRRNLGLNPRGGSGGASSVTIDVSILTNTKAVPQTGLVIPVDPEDDAQQA